jgi:DNA-binding CsgD family transcriptional regulator
MAAGPLRRWAEGSRSDPSLLPRSAADIVDAIEALVRNSDADTVADLRSTIEDTDPVSTVCQAWADGILAESAGASAAAFDSAVGAVDSLPTARPFLSARIALASGERLRRDGERVLARGRLRIALAHFQSLEAEPWAERTGRELRATGEHVRSRATSSLGELTPQELQVARLIASGATYKEAAARLFLSAKTIEFHLGKVYRKLGVRSGKELAALYAREEFE